MSRTIYAHEAQAGMTIETESGNIIAIATINTNAVTITAYDSNGTAWSISAWATVIVIG